MIRTIGATLLLAGLCLTALAPLAPHAAHAQQVSFDQGIELVTVGNPGNAPISRPGRIIDGRGGVSYDFRIGRYEVTTAQWAEFMNAAFDRPQSEWIPHITQQPRWGAVPTTPTVAGGRRWEVPAGNEMRTVAAFSWRAAAIYCNWLHNGRSNARESFLNGAYDVSTFTDALQGFNDQLTRSPGARFYIPSWDEWLKAAHYDPQKQNPDGSVGGWWEFSNRSNTVPNYGPPGLVLNGSLTEANSNWQASMFPGFDPYTVPLGAYPNATNAFGLLDIAGGTSEYTEEAFADRDFAGNLFVRERTNDGSARDRIAFFGSSGSTIYIDGIATPTGSFRPDDRSFSVGLRIAAAIPSPSGLAMAGVVGVVLSTRIRRRGV